MDASALKRLLLFILCLAPLSAALWHYQTTVTGWVGGIRNAHSLQAPPSPDRPRYEMLSAEIERWRVDLAGKYGGCRTEEERRAVLDEARGLLERVLPEMMRCWLGTPWDFHGTAEFPGEGKIACGYFVSTVLRDAGFRLDRYKLARQPSQNILRSFLPREALQLRVGVPYENFAAELASAEPGIRIVGLDSHVAFLVTGGDGFRFIHSSGSAPWCVVDEGETDAEVLRRSNYRVHGLLTADRDLLRRWLRGERIQVRER